MSIYNGFSTRKQEQDYNILLEQTFFLLQTYIAKAIKNEKIDENKFAQYFEKLFNTMEQFESHKYLDPKYSVILRPLAKTLNIKRYQFIEGSELNSSTIIKKQNSPIHSNIRSSSNNFSSVKKTTQQNQQNYENKGTEVTQSGKWLYQTISEAGNQKSQIIPSSSTKAKETEGNFNQEMSPDTSGNGKYYVQLKTISNRVQVQTPSSYRAFCVMTLSPSPSNNSTIQLNENSSIHLRVPKKVKQQSQTLTLERKQEEPEKSISQVTQPCSQTDVLNQQLQQNENNESSTIKLAEQNEEQNIRLDKVVLQKFKIENQVYDEETEQVIQSSRNYNKVYQETSSLSVGRRNNLDPISNSYSLNKQNLLVARNHKKNKLQQQRKLLQEEELELIKKEDKLILQDNQYSTKNDSSFSSQVNGRHSDLSNRHNYLQNNIEQDYIVNKYSKNSRGFILPKGSFLNRNAFSKNVSPVNKSNTINYDDTNYYPIKNFQKAIPILKPLYHSVDTGERMKQESLSIKESKSNQNTRRNSSIQIQINNNSSYKNCSHNLHNNCNSLTQRDPLQVKDEIEDSSPNKVNMSKSQNHKSIQQSLLIKGNSQSYELRQPSNESLVNSQGRCKSFIYYNNNFTNDNIMQLTKHFSDDIKVADINLSNQQQIQSIKSSPSNKNKIIKSKKQDQKNQFQNKNLYYPKPKN